MSKNHHLKGGIVPALLIIVGSFVVVIYGFLFVLGLQLDFAKRQTAQESALNIAEAGINYYLWHLSVDPEDYKDGTENFGPYLHDYKDPQGTNVGSFSLEIIPPTEGSNSVEIVSTGQSDISPTIQRTIRTKYGRESYSRFAVLNNSNLWFGNEVVVNGEVHTNGGIRQDGTNTSILRSSKATYTCGIETGCTTPTEKPGIWGNGGDNSLWNFPTNPIDFKSITIDFNKIMQDSQTNGLYLGPSDYQGYRITFNADGTYSVKMVTSTSFIKGYSLENGCENLPQVIASEEPVGTYTVADTPLIFVEDTLWIEGTLKGTITVAAARFPTDTNDANIWIPNNLVYDTKDGSTRLGLISQNDIIFTRDVPDDFEVNASLLAQHGKILRHHYGYFGCKSTGVDKFKDSFTLHGSLISDRTSYWNFSQGPQSPAAGFKDVVLNFDQNLYLNPPGYFPIYGPLKLISWQEE